MVATLVRNTSKCRRKQRSWMLRSRSYILGLTGFQESGMLIHRIEFKAKYLIDLPEEKESALLPMKE